MDGDTSLEGFNAQTDLSSGNTTETLNKRWKQIQSLGIRYVQLIIQFSLSKQFRILMKITKGM